MRAQMVRLHCLCGDSLVGEVKPPESASRVERAWLAAHHGAGHGAVPAVVCNLARRAREKETVSK